MLTSTQEIELTKYGDRLFEQLSSRIKTDRKWRLLLDHKLNPVRFKLLRLAAAAFLSSCYGYQEALTSEDELLEVLKQKKEILANITPNGLVRPKKEHVVEFNLLHKNVVALFSELNIENLIDTIQLPINFRVQEGKADTKRDRRPFATNKMHTDVWAGEPIDAVIVHIPLFGDPENIGLEFAEILPEHEMKYMHLLEDYDAGKEAETVVRPYADMKGLQLGHAYFADARLLHRTTRKKEGFRVSLDFRFRLKSEGTYRAMSDGVAKEKAVRDYASYALWCKMGSDKMIVFDETYEQAKARFQNSASNVTATGSEHRIIDLF